MDKIERSLELFSCEPKELSEAFQTLVSEAKNALSKSYSPYSKFAVGAAALLDNGEIVKGANQENAAYPSGLCAERVALFSAGVQFPQHKVKALAVALAEPIDKWPFPCGACLQVMAETRERQGEEIELLLLHPTLEKVLWSKELANLLPFAFNKDYLEP